MAASATSLSTFSTLSLHHHPSLRHHFSLHHHPITSLSPQIPKLFFSSRPSLKPTITHCTPPDTIFFETELPEPNTFNPPDLPDDSSPSQTDDVTVLTETEEEIAAAYEELYGPAYSGVSVLGNDVNVMDKKFQKAGAFGKIRKEKVRDGFDERVVQVRRVTKVVKGGKQMHFRAIVVVGDKKGQVGVGVGKAKEVIGAVQKGATDARRNIISIPLTKYMTFPHRFSHDNGGRYSLDD